MNFRSQRTRRSEPDLDMTPLIDVVFLLLIFFLVTATFAQRDQSVVPVDLPEGQSGASGASDARATVYLEADGSFTLALSEDEVERQLTMDALEERLEDLYEATPELPLYLRGDREARYGSVMELLDLARGVGFERVYNVIYDDSP